MKKGLFALITSGLLFTGTVAAAADIRQDCCQEKCSCKSSQTSEKKANSFKTLFPEFEIESPMGG